MIQAEGRDVVSNTSDDLRVDDQRQHLVAGLVPSAKNGAVAAKVEHFSAARPASPGAQSIPGYRLSSRQGRRSADHGGSNDQAQVSICASRGKIDRRFRQGGAFLKGLRKHLDVTDFAAVGLAQHVQQGVMRMTIYPARDYGGTAPTRATTNSSSRSDRSSKTPTSWCRGLAAGIRARSCRSTSRMSKVRRLLQVIGEFWNEHGD